LRTDSPTIPPEILLDTNMHDLNTNRSHGCTTCVGTFVVHADTVDLSSGTQLSGWNKFFTPATKGMVPVRLGATLSECCIATE
jgi:hypothetical protein